MGRVSAELGQRVYLDANLVIYVIEGFLPYLDQIRALMAAVKGGEVVAVTSELTLAEVLVKPFQAQQPALQQAYRIFLQPTPEMEIAPISRAILEESARLRATTKLKLPDAIHLATALHFQCDSLLTNDTQFKALGLPQIKLLADVSLT
ncbi:MAG: type II toxin-antitoxin system VapC family toxin [Blastocatellales bacterium]